MLLLLSTALAATVTEIPPFLHGDGGLTYSFDRLGGSLVQRTGNDDSEVGKRAIASHVIDYHLTFAPGPGVALTLDLPQYVSESVSYSTWQAMVYDPATGTGTALGTNAGDPGVLARGGGFGGLWIDVGGVPFSEAYEGRNNKATWKLDLGFRTGDKSSFWAVDGDGHRGAGTGGSAWRIRSAFSKTIGNAEPYVVGTVTFENKTSVVLASQDGTQLSAGEVEINPADHGELLAGAEILASHNEANGAQVALDLHLACNYAAYGDVASGVFLPDVLDASLGTAVQQAESMELGGGVGFVWRPMEYLQIGAHGELLYHLPQRIESPYPIYTGMGNTTHANVTVNLTVRLRAARDTDVLPPAPASSPAPSAGGSPWGG